MPKNEKIKGFIKNYDLIQEDYRVEDLLDFSEDIATFTNKINAIEKSSIIGLVGKFGSGKSTMLYQIQKKHHSDIKWINFDAWKYPDRHNLWEGFVLDFADQVGVKKKVQKDIDGRGATNQTIDIIGGLTSLVSSGISDLFKSIFKESPATRVFEIQKILQEIINTQNSKKIVIVIEDIDRSGDAGIYFLETLKQFLRDNKFDKRIIVIVPIGDKNYHDKKESYLKCLDFIEYFRPEFKGVYNFIDAAISDEVALSDKYQVSSFCEELFKQPNVTIRLLKIILREADITFKCQIRDGHEPDWRVTFCFEASKHVYTAPDMKLPYDQLFLQNKVISHDSLFASFLAALIFKRETIYESTGRNNEKKLLDSRFDIELITRVRDDGIIRCPSTPYIVDDIGSHRYVCCDFYLNY